MPTQSELRDKPRLRPVYLADIELLNGGPTLHFSEMNITVGATRYEDYVAAAGCSPSGEFILGFKNDRYGSYAALIDIGGTYPFEGATATIKEIYLDDGGTPSEAEVLFKGILGEPRGIDLLGFSCPASGMELKEDLKW